MLDGNTQVKTPSIIYILLCGFGFDPISRWRPIGVIFMDAISPIALEEKLQPQESNSLRDSLHSFDTWITHLGSREQFF